jgi:hypothetical protein
MKDTITIVSQDGEHQYDENGRAITSWNEKYCSWIINPEYETEIIDWQDDMNGISKFPRGCTKAHYLELFPGADNYPDIEVTWHWNEEGYEKAFNEKPKPGEILRCTRDWGYINVNEKDAIKRFGHYCDFNKYAYRVIVKYNKKTIFDGKLE